MSNNSNMDDKTFIGKTKYNCPICEKEEEVEIYKELAQVIIKEQTISYYETYYYCPISKEEFYPSQVLDNNLLEAKDSYRRQNNLLTSQEIKEIRKYYKLNQKEFSNIFGWGDVTVQRYETKFIQDETYNETMKRAKDDPLFLYEKSKKYKDKFDENRFKEIEILLKNEIEKKQIIYLNKECLRALYLDYEIPSEFNGNKIFDIEKTEQMLRFFAQANENLYKTKLMKLFWYSDSYHYQKYGTSISGMVYEHLPYGAVPIGGDEILGASRNSIVVSEERLWCKDDGEEVIGYKINNLKKMDKAKLETSEISVIELVNKKFQNLGSAAISRIMHAEEAYKNTKDGDLISFKWAKILKDF